MFDTMFRKRFSIYIEDDISKPQVYISIGNEYAGCLGEFRIDISLLGYHLCVYDDGFATLSYMPEIFIIMNAASANATKMAGDNVFKEVDIAFYLDALEKELLKFGYVNTTLPPKTIQEDGVLIISQCTHQPYNSSRTISYSIESDKPLDKLTLYFKEFVMRFATEHNYRVLNITPLAKTGEYTYSTSVHYDICKNVVSTYGIEVSDYAKSNLPTAYDDRRMTFRAYQSLVATSAERVQENLEKEIGRIFDECHNSYKWDIHIVAKQFRLVNDGMELVLKTCVPISKSWVDRYKPKLSI